MMGKSYRENPHISFDDLALVKALYYGFDDETHQGEMVIYKDLAQELMEILQELYEKKFPIERMELIDVYDADDDESMNANNSSAFCYRELTGGGGLSSHAFGIAVDINPLYNPYVREWENESLLILPPAGFPYMERDPSVKGGIVKGNDCYNAFVSRGWEWGGEWTEFVDYQHFQKNITK